MANIETQILSKNFIKPTVWKRYVDNKLIFSLWEYITKPDNEQFIEKTNSDHPTIKFTAEISDRNYISRYSDVRRRKIQGTIYP